jgi:hypothetical protein
VNGLVFHRPSTSQLRGGLYISTDKPNLHLVAPDPFDPDALRLDQSFLYGSTSVEKLLTTVPVRKPNPQDFVRTHPDVAYRLTAALIELRDDREVYLVSKGQVSEFSPCRLFATINRHARDMLLQAEKRVGYGEQERLYRGSRGIPPRAARLHMDLAKGRKIIEDANRFPQHLAEDSPISFFR